MGYSNQEHEDRAFSDMLNGQRAHRLEAALLELASEVAKLTAEIKRLIEARR